MTVPLSKKFHENQKIIDSQELHFLIIAWPVFGNIPMYFITEKGILHSCENYKEHINGNMPVFRDVLKKQSFKGEIKSY